MQLLNPGLLQDCEIAAGLGYVRLGSAGTGWRWETARVTELLDSADERDWEIAEALGYRPVPPLGGWALIDPSEHYPQW